MGNLSGGRRKRFSGILYYNTCELVPTPSPANFELSYPSSYGVFFLLFRFKLYSPLPKSQLLPTTRSPPNIADRRDSTSLLTQHFSQVFLHSTNFKILQGFPPKTGFREFVCPQPTRESFRTRQSFRFEHTQLVKTSKFQLPHTPIHNFEFAAHSKRPLTHNNLPQTTVSAVLQSQTSTNQHRNDSNNFFLTTFTSARNHFQHSTPWKIT